MDNPPHQFPAAVAPAIEACFLGPYGENDALLEKLVVEFLRDHVYWRRNFHPEDPPAIPTSAAARPEFQRFEARLRRELHALSAALKRSVPFHSPRYLGHMVTDVSLPALAAQMVALPYNPNNISADAAPVTIDMELKAGLQLARMLGFVDDPARADCAFGHLTSGGTVANYQALRLALALKAFPVALRAAAPPGCNVPDDDWLAFNLAPADAIALLDHWTRWLAGLPPRERRGWQARFDAERIETLGMAAFFARHPLLSPPRVLAPVTAHYSWSKGVKLLGLGREQLELLPERGMRVDTGVLAGRLEALARARQPVLMVVAVMGTTEFGAVDPLHEVLALRREAAGRGLGLSVHVDGAWGGYLSALFRAPDGTVRPLEQMQGTVGNFPSADVHAAFAAMGGCDSVTVDPHKLGFVPYGAGAFVCRDQRAMALLAEDADYVFEPPGATDFFTRFRQIGRFIPEGSRAGAAAAAVYVAQRVLPLDSEHFGVLLAEGLRGAHAFRDAAEAFARRIADVAHCCVPFEPDTHLVCIALNPRGNRRVERANALVRELHASMRSEPARPVQDRAFFGCLTTLHPQRLGPAGTARLLERVGLPADAFEVTAGEDGDRLAVLRHTLVNPFVIDRENGISYIDAYFDWLEQRLREALPAAPLAAAGVSQPPACAA